MLAVGLMSGTSLDGVDAALIETDGEAVVRPIGWRSEPWSDPARAELMAVTELALTFGRPRASPPVVAAEALVTRVHALAVRKLLNECGASPEGVGVIGFHGQTIAHRPDRGWTWQIGDGALLATATGIATVNDFRSADVAAGGQGAPLIPIYHAALAAAVARPVALLNLGGVANLTSIDRAGDLIAFDCGPGNGMIDQWVQAHTGARFDRDGALARAGRTDEAILTALLDHPFFAAPPPKSLDRYDFPLAAVRGLTVEDGAATLTAFTAQAVADGVAMLPERPLRLIVVGGGRHNPVLMAAIAGRTGLPVEAGDALGWNGDATEAEGFAYMAVRRLKGLPISFPGTTGVTQPMVGGVLHPIR